MLFSGVLPRAEPGKPIYAEDWNALVAAIEFLVGPTLGQDRIDTAVGSFPTSRARDLSRFELNDTLDSTVTDGVEAKLLAWDGTDFVDTGITKTVYGTFMTGSRAEGDWVIAHVAGGRWEVMSSGGGSSVQWGKANSDWTEFSDLYVSVWEGNYSDGADTGVDLLCIAPGTDGEGGQDVIGLIVEVPSFHSVSILGPRYQFLPLECPGGCIEGS